LTNNNRNIDNFFLLVDIDRNSSGKVQSIIINENIDEIFFVGIFLMEIMMEFYKKKICGKFYRYFDMSINSNGIPNRNSIANIKMN